MEIELMLLFALIGVGTGSLSASINVAPSLIAIPALYFFLPLLNMNFDNWFLPMVATCLTAFIPTYMYAWIQSMKARSVDFQRLINITPGVVMGGIIGAQMLSLLTPLFFKFAFSSVVIASIFFVIFYKKIVSFHEVNIGKRLYLLIGVLTGCSSVVSGTCGRVFVQYLYTIKHIPSIQRQGTIEGVSVFTSIAAMVGFIYPARITGELELVSFAGAIHLPSMFVLSLSHFFFYWLSSNKGTELDKKVLTVSFMVFLSISLIRIWI